MALGFLFAGLTFVGILAAGVLIGLLINLIPGLSANFEAIGAICGWSVIVAAPIAFVKGFRKQSKRNEEKKRREAKPEQLRPTNFSGLKDTLSAIDEANKKAKP